MKTLEIHIPDEVASKIKQVAKHMGISIEELLRTSFEEKDPARRAIRECRRSGAREERRALSAALVVRYISIEEAVGRSTGVRSPAGCDGSRLDLAGPEEEV